MVRYGVILGLVFQSLLLLCCAGRLPVASGAVATGGCQVATHSSESSCCCQDDGASVDEPTSIDHPVFAKIPERCCECPLTVDSPRVPAVPDRRPGIELTRLSLAVGAAFSIALPDHSFCSFASVPALSHPPEFAGRQACERFCRWTI
ncbi:MAG: hypothetical protein ACREJD_14195 [Phycisphaerales bacterium]